MADGAGCGGNAAGADGGDRLHPATPGGAAPQNGSDSHLVRGRTQTINSTIT